MAAQDERTIGMPGESAMSSELGAPGLPDPAPGAAIQRRLEARGEGAPRIIAVQGAGSVAGRVARLAQSRLPLLDALQRRWSASAAWPGMPELPLVTPLTDASGAPAANPAETDSPGRAGFGVIGRPSGPQLPVASLTPSHGALSTRAAQPTRAARAETSRASGVRPTGLVQTQADENAPTVPAAPIPTVTPGLPGKPSPGHVPPSGERWPDAARADLPLASGGLAHQAQSEAQPAPARAAKNEPGHGASGSLPPAPFVPAASAVPQGFVQEAPPSPAGSPLAGQSQTRPESVPPGSSITLAAPAELPLSSAKPGLRAKREAQPGTVRLAAEPASPSAPAPTAAPASTSDLPVVTPSLAWPVHSAAARAASAAQAADIIQGSSDATRDVIAGQPPAAAQAARAVMGTPAEPAASAGVAPPVPVVGPALPPRRAPSPPPTPAAAQAQPAPGPPTTSAATARLPLPIVQARRADPARAPEVQAFAPYVLREASAELSAPEVSGTATPPAARPQPATIERAQLALPIVQQAAAPVRAPAIDTTAPGSSFSRSPSTSGVVPPAPGVVRVWGAPIVQRSAARLPDAQAAAETRRGSPLGRAVSPSGAPAPGAQSAGGSSITAGGPLRGTVARTPGGESAAPVALPLTRQGEPAPRAVTTTGGETPPLPGLPLAGQGDSPLPTARTVSSPVAAASGITSGDAGAGSLQPATARAIPAAPPPVAGAPAIELRLARPVAAPRLAEPPTDIMLHSSVRAVPVETPAVASAPTVVGAPGVIGVPAAELRLARPAVAPRLPEPASEIGRIAAPAVIGRMPAASVAGRAAAHTLQLSAQGTSAPAAASSAAQETPPGASGVTAPPQETTAPPPRRLDETEMARVVDAVLTTLQQRLQLERESRGL